MKFSLLDEIYSRTWRIAGPPRFRVFIPLLFFLSAQLLPGAPPRKDDSVFFNYRRQQAEYVGPGSDIPAPENPAEILIAYFGPGNSNHPEYGDLWTALQIAEDHLNESGGFQGIPIKVISIWTEDPWKGGISDMVKAVYTQDIWAMIGSVDSASTHLLEQIAAKIRIPVINPVSSDKTANLANVPWLFSMLPGDHILAEALVEKMKQILGQDGSFVLVSGMDHDSRQFTTEIRNLMEIEKLVPEYIFNFQPDRGIPLELINNETSLVVIIAPPSESAHLVQKLRGLGWKGSILGGPFMGRHRFRELCREYNDDIHYISPGSCSPDSSFAMSFRQATGKDPDYAAASTFDALLLLGEAIKKAGLNRVKILREIRTLTPWMGAAGSVEWDPLGQNSRKGCIKSFSSRTGIWGQN